MFFNFSLRYFINPEKLANKLQKSTIQGIKKHIIIVFFSGFILFSLRSLWGVNTELLTSILVNESPGEYALVRIASLLGSMVWSVIYISFHLFGISFLLSYLINIPIKKLLPMQLLMTILLLIEKGLVFLVFVIRGETTSVSFLSFGPLAATFLETPFYILLLNQITLTTMLIIAFQFQFIRKYSDIVQRQRLIWLLIGIHFLMAIITASVGFIPAESLFETITGGGVGK